MKILLVDSNDDYVRGLQELLEGDDHEVILATNVQQARGLLEHRPAVMIIDDDLVGQDDSALIPDVRVCYPGTVIIVNSAEELEHRAVNNRIQGGAHHVHVKGGTSLMRIIAKIAERRVQA